MLYTIVALHNYEQLYGSGKYQDALSRWLEKAQTVWLDKKNGTTRIYANAKATQTNKQSAWFVHSTELLATGILC